MFDKRIYTANKIAFIPVIYCRSIMLAILALRANIVFPAFVSIRLLIFHSLTNIFFMCWISRHLAMSSMLSRSAATAHVRGKMCLARRFLRTTHTDILCIISICYFQRVALLKMYFSTQTTDYCLLNKYIKCSAKNFNQIKWLGTILRSTQLNFKRYNLL